MKKKNAKQWNISIKGKIIAILSLVIVTNIIIGLNGLNNLKNVQDSLEESLKVRAANLNLLRTGDIDLHQMYLAEKDLYIYKPDTEEFKKQLEEYNNQKNDVLKKFAKYKENLLFLPEEEKLVQNYEQLREEYFKLSAEIVSGLSMTDTVKREQSILLSQTEGYQKFDAAEDSLDAIGDLYFDDNERMYENAKEEYKNLILVTVILIVICLIISLILGVIVIRALILQINYLKDNVKKMTEGDLTVRIPKLTNDELGELSEDFNVMVEQTKDLIAMVSGSAEELNTSSMELAAISEETAESTNEIRKAISEISEGASWQAQLVDGTNQKTMDLSQAIETVNNKNKEMNILSSEAESVLNVGIEKVTILQEHTNKFSSVNRKIVEKVNVLMESMKNITYIVETLNAISEQTNLLALNAGIEAARAGEHGKGFAVVADEIRKLASQSSKASNEIKETIIHLEKEVEQTFELMGQTDQAAKDQSIIVHDTEASFHTISKTINHMLKSIQVIKTDVMQANELRSAVVDAIQDISKVTGKAAATTQHINSSMDGQAEAFSNLQNSAEQLHKLSEKVTIMIHRFNLG